MEVKDLDLNTLRPELIGIEHVSCVQGFIDVLDQAVSSKFSLMISGDMYPVLG